MPPGRRTRLTRAQIMAAITFQAVDKRDTARDIVHIPDLAAAPPASVSSPDDWLFADDEAAKPRQARIRKIIPGASEAQVLNAVLGFLRRHPDVMMVWRNNVGMAEFDGQPVRFGFTGLADISFVLRGGRAGFVEVKRERGGRVSAAQQAFLDRAREAGAMAGVCRSIDDVIALMRG